MKKQIKNLPKAGDICKIFNFIDFEKDKFEVAIIRHQNLNCLDKSLVMVGLSQNNRKWKYSYFELGLTNRLGNFVLNKNNEPVYKLTKIRDTKWGYTIWKVVYNPIKKKL